ncbi:MAG: hypothetical protein COU46_02910 [Candidatus Niyogibacteria bacterium CG10_big_fil_rev_8_21_14_0_10_42_19]|uniref:histidine kinase n=1 Tax=Candidatus Niyogibacteria bacterium CG10_big_fil_rev_8_21_14_0_10_42_19 TaxID=1974725 RepID=A0A2H0TF76_9BACT|nr:MAG: hypothetical protein COU46_02910 [Candidatus Niyogibacteria bacterium CG10_big_fil_rev_8_21_14_0_10_42_19]
MKQFLKSLNVKKYCYEYGIDLWQCPQFLFIIMGVIIIIAIIVTNITARLYADPEIAALIVLTVTAFLFIVGSAVVHAFEKVAEVSRAKSEFISVVSHEMRNPLSSIKWQLELIKDSAQKMESKEISEAVEDISVENSKALRLVNDLLEAYRIEDNKMILQPAPFSLAETTQSAIEKFERTAKQSNISLSLFSSENLPQAYADPKKVQSVVEHLIDNALRYSEKGEIVISIDKKGGRLLWSISDQGVGIPKEEFDLLFSKFFRSHNRLRYHTGGLGLGLYLMREIVKASGGTIKVHSIEGKGTTFWITLPTSPLK